MWQSVLSHRQDPLWCKNSLDVDQNNRTRPYILYEPTLDLCWRELELGLRWGILLFIVSKVFFFLNFFGLFFIGKEEPAPQILCTKRRTKEDPASQMWLRRGYNYRTESGWWINFPCHENISPHRFVPGILLVGQCSKSIMNFSILNRVLSSMSDTETNLDPAASQKTN
jgi:hypothetical protein